VFPSNQQFGKIVVDTLAKLSNPSVHGKEEIAAQGVTNDPLPAQLLLSVPLQLLLTQK
jgi:hypothetical protein